MTVTLPTVGELGRGELPYTSIAVGFRLFGLHDWAGRIPLAMWIIVALIAIVAWVNRFFNQRAAIWTALVFPTIPIVFFQARFMLGDATTVGTITTSFVALCFGCIRSSNCDPVPTMRRLSWLLIGAAVSLMGVMSRGLLLGVAVPYVAAGLAGLLIDRRRCAEFRVTSTEKVLAIVVLAVGALAAVAGVLVTMKNEPQRGLALVLQGSAPQRNYHSFAFDSAFAQLGHSMFPWSGVLVFAVASVFARIEAWTCHIAQQRALAALVLVVFLAMAVQTWIGSLGVTIPFPAVAALAAIIGIWLDSVSKHGTNLRIVSIGTIALLVVLVADLETFPDKILAATASSDAHVPLGFRRESSQWAQGCCVAIFGSLLVANVGFGRRARSILSHGEFRKCVRRISSLWLGQFGFFVLLVETALVTGAALLLATRMGFPFRRLTELGSPQRELLLWSWLLLPAIALALFCGRLLLEGIGLLFSAGCGIPSIAESSGVFGPAATRLLVRIPGLRKVVISRGALCGVCYLGAAMAFSLGWATRLGEQLSPRRALSQYAHLARAGEPLGLLGVRPQVTQYYSAQRPEVLLDPEEAADWLLFEKVRSRWMIVRGDQFPRLNAAYRERCQCLRNVPVLDGRSSDMLLVSNRRVSAMPSENPLDDVLLDQTPQPQQKLDADFGGQVQALGWELVSSNGDAIAELGVGHKYELRLFYRVTARPTTDWETFVHIDGFGRRYNGDHDTTQGQYPMTNWRAGDLIVDKHTIVLDPSFSHGNYELYFGFFKGSRRLEVRRGRQDENRLIAGMIRVR
jgi:hypothetical protein